MAPAQKLYLLLIRGRQSCNVRRQVQACSCSISKNTLNAKHNDVNWPVTWRKNLRSGCLRGALDSVYASWSLLL